MKSPHAQGACLFNADTGTGKTVMAVTYIMETAARTVLIVAPLQTLGDPEVPGDGWRGTFERQQSDLPFRQIDSSESGQAALADYQWGVRGVYFVGKEMFTRMGWEDQLLFVGRGANKKPRMKNGKQMTKRVPSPAWISFEPDVVVFDEIHYGQNVDSWTAKTMAQVRAGFLIGSSGTVEGNSFDGAYMVTRILWPHLSEKNIYDWRHKWAETEYDHFAVRNERTVGEKNPGAYFNSLPCYIRLESDFKIDVQKREYKIKLYPEQMNVYEELDEKMVAWIHDNPLVVKFPMTKRVRQRQATLGMPTITYDENGDPIISFDKDCLSMKIDHGFKEILDGWFEGEPAVIYTDSQQFAEVLVHRLDQRYGEGSAREWSGKISKAKRKPLKSQFIAGEFKYLVGVITAMGTGTDGLQKAAHNGWYVSSSDSRIDNQQSFARLDRRGQVSPFIRMAWSLALDTVDVGQYSNHIKQALLANARAKKRRTK